MQSRILYKEVSPGYLVSTLLYNNNKLILDLNEGKGYVMEAETEKLIYMTASKSHVVLKRKLKEYLENTGFQFQEEKRNTKGDQHWRNRK